MRAEFLLFRNALIYDDKANHSCAIHSGLKKRKQAYDHEDRSQLRLFNVALIQNISTN